MAPSHSRHLLVWTALPFTVLLSYLWYRKKRAIVPSDPGKKSEQLVQSLPALQDEEEKLDESNRTFSRSDSAPIDIVLPPELRSTKSSQLVISDEDLDIEIEKIKSMKSSKATPTKMAVSTSTKTPANTSNEIAIKASSKSVDTPKKVLKTPTEQANASNKTPSKGNQLSTTPSNNLSASLPCKTVASTLSSKKATKSPKKVAASPHKIEEDKIVELVESPIEEKVECKDAEKCEEAISNHNEIHRLSSERDSANHSPADVMLASPSLSSISDSHSEGSSDSGKGCSEVATPPSRTPAGDTNVRTITEFLVPQALVGRLIGRHGCNIAQIKEKTHAHLLVRQHPTDQTVKVCSVEGFQADIDAALEMIRKKFPIKRHPELTLEAVQITPLIPTIPLIPEQLCLQLVEGVNNDTVVSCMVAPNHLFLQQPAHPTFPNLNLLSSFMNMAYGDANSPLLPSPIPERTVCVAYSLGAWYRAIVLTTDEESESSYIKFLDYGGFATINNSELRQIRADFLMLPFQASECILANVKPVGGEDAEWCDEAFSLVADLTKGAVVHTQVAEFTQDDIPLVLIYIVVPKRIIFLNGELVSRGYAEWTDKE